MTVKATGRNQHIVRKTAMRMCNKEYKKNIYNHSWIFNLMRDHTKGKELG